MNLTALLEYFISFASLSLLAWMHLYAYTWALFVQKICISIVTKEFGVQVYLYIY